jgi:tetratricopeptide (TPR) repeat protein
VRNPKLHAALRWASNGALLAAVAAGAALFLAPAEIRVWVDAQGVTHATNEPSAAPASARSAGEVRSLWGDERFGAPLRKELGASSSDDDRAFRALRDALVDLQRGDTPLAVSRLHDVLRRDASRPEAHFYLALIEGRRGRLDAAEAHLRAFLSVAGDGYDEWRASALRRLGQLDQERRLMNEPSASEPRFVSLRHPDFTIEADEALVQAGGEEFAATVRRLLDDAHAHVGDALGIRPEAPTGVVLYGRANYVRANAHRFSFQTVGFYDGRIHVVSAAYPGGELRGLLVHEYTHALFKTETGGDTPYWLNEGLAELLERSALRRPPLSRGEEIQLRSALAAGEWLPLRRIAASFSGLSDKQARLAYAISTATADWLVRNSTADARGELLRSLGRGADVDAALRVAIGLDTDGVDAAVRRELEAARAPAAEVAASR